MSSNDRFLSLVDQGVVSAINFLHIWLVAKYSNSEQTIYDPLAGSGSILLAAQKLGHNWLGSEISAEYCRKKSFEKVGILATRTTVEKGVYKGD